MDTPRHKQISSLNYRDEACLCLGFNIWCASASSTEPYKHIWWYNRRSQMRNHKLPLLQQITSHSDHTWRYWPSQDNSWVWSQLLGYFVRFVELFCANASHKANYRHNKASYACACCLYLCLSHRGGKRTRRGTKTKEGLPVHPLRNAPAVCSNGFSCIPALTTYRWACLLRPQTLTEAWGLSVPSLQLGQ